MRKRLVILLRCFMASLIMLAITAKSFSQPDKIPPFQMMQANGKVFLAGNLPAGKPIVIIYFSPDCKECHDLTAEILNRIEEFENISIAMITNMPVGHVKYFVSQFNLGKYPNIYAGTEGYSSFVGGYYHVDKIPFLALHNKNGDLEKVYRGEVSIEDLLVHLRRL